MHNSYFLSRENTQEEKWSKKMFEEMLKDLLLKMIREDEDVQAAIITTCANAYDTSVKHAVKFSIENDESVQDVIRKQATMDIWEAIEEDVDMAIAKEVDSLIVMRGQR